MALYHKDLGFPANMRVWRGCVEPEYTAHSVQAARSDRYGRIKLPTTVNLNRCELVEAEVDCDGHITKAVYRTRYDADFDLVLVLVPRVWRVKTVWLNRRDDLHHTAKYGKYVKP